MHFTALIPEAFQRQIVVIGFNDDFGATFHGDQIAEVFSGVVTFRKELRKRQTTIQLSFDAPEVASVKPEIRGGPPVSYDDEVDALLAASLCTGIEDLIWR